PSGLPRMMIAYEPMEVIVSPEITHILIEHLSELRRIYTDGRNWPEFIEPSFSGYSIGKWVDTHGDGRFDVLEVETRGFKGPRNYDSSGIPLHADQQSVIKERIYLDPGNAGILRDEITTIDHALTKPWTVTRSYHRADKVIWTENICTEDNHHVIINHE